MTVRHRPATLTALPNIDGVIGSVRAHTEAVMLDAFSSEDPWGSFLDTMDAFGMYQSLVANPYGILDRLIPMLEARGKGVEIWMPGPHGWDAIVSGLDTGIRNGTKSAEYDLTYVMGPIEALGGTVTSLVLDSPRHRLQANGYLGFEVAHAARQHLQPAGTDNDLTYTAVTAGAAGNAIRVRYVVAGISTALSVSVSGTDITVNVATDGSGVATSTAAAVASAVAGSGPASALVTVTNLAGNDGSGVVAAIDWMRLRSGDNGVRYPDAEAAEAIAAYLRVMKIARPRMRLWMTVHALDPFDGVAGFASAAGDFLLYQITDLKPFLTTLVGVMADYGVSLDGCLLDMPVEGFSARPRFGSWRAEADDWGKRALDIGEHVRSLGMAYGVVFNSTWGGNRSDYVAFTNPIPTYGPSDQDFTLRVLEFVRRFDDYVAANRPGWGAVDALNVGSWYHFPEEIA